MPPPSHPLPSRVFDARVTRPRAEAIATATRTSPLPPPRATFICRARKGLKMLVALERVLKGFKASRFKLSFSLSLSLFGFD